MPRTLVSVRCRVIISLSWYSETQLYRRPGHQTQTDLTRLVKWPTSVHLQRQKVILHQRLMVPPALAQFSQTLFKNTAMQFKLLYKYRPESKQEKKARLIAAAVSAAEKEKDAKVRPFLFLFRHLFHSTSDIVVVSRAPRNPSWSNTASTNMAALIEAKKAAFVVIAHNIDPIELVVFLPALWRKMASPIPS